MFNFNKLRAVGYDRIVLGNLLVTLGFQLHEGGRFGAFNLESSLLTESEVLENLAVSLRTPYRLKSLGRSNISD